MGWWKVRAHSLQVGDELVGTLLGDFAVKAVERPDGVAQVKVLWSSIDGTVEMWETLDPFENFTVRR